MHRLPVRERSTEHIRRAQRAGGRIGACVRNQHQRAAFLRHLEHAHGHPGMHRADEDIDLVARDQPVRVLRRLGRIGFVVDFEEIDFTSAEFPARLVKRELESVLDRGAELRVSACVRQHEPDTKFGRLCKGNRRQHRSPRNCTCSNEQLSSLFILHCPVLDFLIDLLAPYGRSPYMYMVGGRYPAVPPCGNPANTRAKLGVPFLVGRLPPLTPASSLA